MKGNSLGGISSVVLIAVMSSSSLPVAAQDAAGHTHSQKDIAAAAEIHASRRRFSPELERIKSLAGKWEGTTFRNSEGTHSAIMTYVITGAGSAVIEVMFPGTPGEMTTVYHDDSSGRLVAEHYCNAGNQPKLRLVESGPNHLKFVLAPDSDIKAQLEHHAHELNIAFGADGSLTHDWLNFYLGDPAQARNIQLTRVK